MASARVDGERIKIVLGGQDGKPLALDNIDVSAIGPAALITR